MLPALASQVNPLHKVHDLQGEKDENVAEGGREAQREELGVGKGTLPLARTSDAN